MGRVTPFPPAADSGAPELAELGGKGLSLWKMSSLAGVCVPSGFVLTTTFFGAWFDELKGQPCWADMLEAAANYDPRDDVSVQCLHRACEAAKAACGALSLDDDACKELQSALQVVTAECSDAAASSVAVRSSGPAEDLAGLSFAGGYETVLAVRAEISAIQDAVRRVFMSCLDERIFAYKVHLGIADLTPQIAVIVQKQVAAAVAGVAFSIDPVSNCYDWATINANWGLGTSIGNGQCSPDYYLVNKVTGKLLRRKLGRKEMSVWLNPEGGGTYEKAVESTEYTLSEGQVRLVMEGLSALEQFYGHHVDTEFAIDDLGRLYWLQCRPVTTHVPLHEQLATAPGKPEVLWMDLMQTHQGIENASIMGTSVLQEIFSRTSKLIGLDPASATKFNRPFRFVPECGGFYLNVSFLLRQLGWSRKAFLADKIGWLDLNTGLALDECDDPLLAQSCNRVFLTAYLAWNLPGLPANIIRSRRDPEGAKRRAENALAIAWSAIQYLYSVLGYRDECAPKGAFQEHEQPSQSREWIGSVRPTSLETLFGHNVGSDANYVPLPEVVEMVLHKGFPYILRNIVVGMWSGIIRSIRSYGKACALFSEAPHDIKSLLEDLRHTPTVSSVLSYYLEEMGDALKEEGWTCDSVDELKAAASNKGDKLPEKARLVWQKVLGEFGHRGPLELDIMHPRNYEEPEMLLEQVLSTMRLPPEKRPKGLASAALARRKASEEKLSAWLGSNGGNEDLLKSYLDSYYSCFCYRESSKYLIVKLLDLMRRVLLAEARYLVAAGRLDAQADIWRMTLTDLCSIAADSSKDARAVLEQRNRYRASVRHVRPVPKLFTSRGRELLPGPREAEEGQVMGHAVSAGVTTGRVKVLRTPREKPLLVGEILVAKVTDPGWTPLFMPAAAVLLEVGGALQHGALVARELGKPCVVGIQQIRDVFQDGMLVEVDGTQGTVKILEQQNLSDPIVA